MITNKDCADRFGDPHQERNMSLYDVPTRLEIGVIPNKIYCNKYLVKPLEKAFENLIRTGRVAELKTYNGCFNIRKKTASNSWSLHSFGLAIDVNSAWNSYGKTPTLSAEFVKCFKDAGFDWGGDWKTPDGMHFQLKEFPEIQHDYAQITEGSLWKHKNGTIYKIKFLTNITRDDNDFPATVVYENTTDNTMWSRPVTNNWFESMEKVVI